MKLTLLFTSLFLALGFSTRQSKPEIKVTLITKDVEAPVAMACPLDKSKRLFVCEQTGKIKVIQGGVLQQQILMDVGDKLDKMAKIYSEKGLLGMAFHPKFSSNGKFYIYYTAPEAESGFDHKNVVAEYTMAPQSNTADVKSQRIVLEVKQPQSNRCGGQLAFGPDGFLYIGLGDGGGAGDKHGEMGNGQNLETLLGKILRIDVDGKLPYVIPADNPFVKSKNARPEIWAYGLRNPWRFSFDRKTERLFCADVGQNKWEEIDLIVKGKNYGWRIMEGAHCYNPPENCNTSGLEMPIAEYDHDKGVSVTGGFVYRGKNKPALQGLYVFGDWRGNMFYLKEADAKWTLTNMLIEGEKNNDVGFNINSFGEDEEGEIYLLGQKLTGTLISNGLVYKID
jgi:glucose/arabinose dehydrogenase